MRRTIYLVLLASLFLVACTESTGEEKSSPFAITHVNLVPMTSEVILEDQIVLIDGSRIAAIGLTGEVHIPEGTTIIDGQGAYLMPGLADMHMHTTPAWKSEWPVSPFVLYLANGVTTVRNLDPLPDASGQDHPSPDYVLAWRGEIQSGKQPGPTMYTTGLSLQGIDDWRPSVLEAGDAARVVQENVDKNYDLLKIFEYYPQEHFAEAMAAAKENNMYVTGHIPFEVGLEAAVRGGMDEIAHILPILIWERVGAYQPGMTRGEFMPAWQTTYLTQWDGIDPQTWYAHEQETIARIIEILHIYDVNLCTTVAGPDITAHLITDYDSFIARVDMQYSRRRYLDLIARGEDSGQQAFSQNPGLLDHFTYERDVWLRALKDSGNTLILGTDSGIGMGLVPGFSVHGELLTLVNAGFTPYEAIATGTVNASKVVEEMTGVDDFGTIEVGKRPDLILIGGNPLEDIANIQDIRGVMAAGRWYSRETLDALISLE
jgi:imidazolonepropionase-like amidohydrolase